MPCTDLHEPARFSDVSLLETQTSYAYLPLKCGLKLRGKRVLLLDNEPIADHQNGSSLSGILLRDWLHTLRSTGADVTSYISSPSDASINEWVGTFLIIVLSLESYWPFEDLLEKARSRGTLVSVIGNPERSDLILDNMCLEPLIASSMQERQDIMSEAAFPTDGPKMGSHHLVLETHKKRSIEDQFVEESPEVTNENDCKDQAQKGLSKRSKNAGSVTLVGAGPGGLEYLTVAAVKALQDADIVVADRLIPNEVLELARGKLFVARKVPGCAEAAQKELDQTVISALNEGQRVVRLKNGDPFVFGRGGEEILTYRQAGYSSTVVPGISSCVAAPLLGGIPVTMRGIANQFVVITGHGKKDTYTDVPSYAKNRTTVVLMAVGRLAKLEENLQKENYPEEVRIGIVEKAGTAQQRVIKTNLKCLVKAADEHNVTAPATIIIGDVVQALDSGHSSQHSGMMAQDKVALNQG